MLPCFPVSADATSGQYIDSAIRRSVFDVAVATEAAQNFKEPVYCHACSRSAVASVAIVRLFSSFNTLTCFTLGVRVLPSRLALRLPRSAHVAPPSTDAQVELPNPRGKHFGAWLVFLCRFLLKPPFQPTATKADPQEHRRAWPVRSATQGAALIHWIPIGDVRPHQWL